MFDFDYPYENDASDYAALADELVFTLDGELGYISHLLVAPTSNRAVWAVVVDDQGDHHAIPVRLFGWVDQDDEVPYRVGLSRVTVESVLMVTDPDRVSEQHLTDGVREALARLTEYEITHPEPAAPLVRELTTESDFSVTSGTNSYATLAISDYSGAGTVVSGGGSDGSPDTDWTSTVDPDQVQARDVIGDDYAAASRVPRGTGQREGPLPRPIDPKLTILKESGAAPHSGQPARWSLKCQSR